MSETLSNKTKYYLDGVKIHHDSDILKAVNWLKERLKYMHWSRQEQKDVFNDIDEAFEDVVR